jgi:hypothetical protein
VLGGVVDGGASGGQVLGVAQQLSLTLFWESRGVARAVPVHEGLGRRETESFAWL